MPGFLVVKIMNLDNLCNGLRSDLLLLFPPVPSLAGHGVPEHLLTRVNPVLTCRTIYCKIRVLARRELDSPPRPEVRNQPKTDQIPIQFELRAGTETFLIKTLDTTAREHPTNQCQIGVWSWSPYSD